MSVEGATFAVTVDWDMLLRFVATCGIWAVALLALQQFYHLVEDVSAPFYRTIIMFQQPARKLEKVRALAILTAVVLIAFTTTFVRPEGNGSPVHITRSK